MTPAAQWMRDVEIEAGRTTELVVSLEQTATLRGRIRTPASEERYRMFGVYSAPVERAHISFDTGTVADPEGFYFLPGLTPGERQVWIRTGDYGGRIMASTSIDLAPGENRVLDFEFGAGSLKGEVVDASGSPLGNAKVALRPAPAAVPEAHHCWVQSRADGSFAMEGLVPGPYVLSAAKQEYGRVAREVSIAEPPLEQAPERIELEPEAVLLGRITDRSGAPVEGAAYELRRDLDPAALQPRTGKTGNGGGFEVSELASGAYTLWIRKDGYVPMSWALTLSSGQRAELSFAVRRPGSIAVRLTRADGLPASGAGFALTDLESGTDVARWIAEGIVTSSTGGLFADEKGKCELEGIPEGDYAIAAMGMERTVEVPPGAEPAKVSLVGL